MKRTLALVLTAVMLLSVFSIIPASTFAFADGADFDNAFTNENNQKGYVKGGATVVSDEYSATDFITAEAGNIVYVAMMYAKHENNIPVIECYDASKKFVEDIYVEDLATNERIDLTKAIVSAVLPIGTSYIKVNSNNFMTADLLITVNEKVDKETYYAYIGETAPYDIRYDSPLLGKSAMFLGDSIVSGLCENSTTIYPSGIRSWGGRIGTFNAMTFKNKGIDGWTIGQTSWGEGVMIYNQFKDEKDVYDFVVLEGGVNDLWAEGKIGTVSAADNFTTFDKTTYAGALEWYFSEMKKKFPSAIICYIMVYDTQYATAGSAMVKDPATLDKLWAEGKKICEKWDIPYFDMYNSEKIAELLHQGESKRTEYLYDGVHPTFKGYEAIYPEIQAWMEDLIEAKYPNGVPSVEIENPTFSIKPSVFGAMENWANSPNKGDAESVYQILVQAQNSDGSPVAALVNTACTWIMTITGSDGSEKTITIKPATVYSDFLTRFETVIQDEANQFIPKGGVKYTINAKVMDQYGNIWTGTGTTNAFACATGFEATVPYQYNYGENDDPGIKFAEESVTIGMGSPVALQYKFVPKYHTDDITLTWKTSDSSVVTVKDGVVTPEGSGTATVTATNAAGGYTASIKVTVKEIKNVASGLSVYIGEGKTSQSMLTDGVVDGSHEYCTIPQPYDVNTSKAYYEIDLGKAYSLDSIKVVGYLADWYYKWEAYATNDKTAAISSWTKIAEKTSETSSSQEYKNGTKHAVEGEYRFIRIYGVDINEYSYHMFHLTEIEVWANVSSTIPNSQLGNANVSNVKVNGTVTNKLTDGNKETDGVILKAEGGSITMDMGEVKEISTIVTYNNYGNNAAYDLFGSVDGETWKYLDTRYNADERATADFAGVELNVNGSYRYLKIVGRQDAGRGDYAACVGEVEIFDKSGNALTISKSSADNVVYYGHNKLQNGNKDEQQWVRLPSGALDTAVIDLGSDIAVQAIKVYAENGVEVSFSSDNSTWVSAFKVTTSGKMYYPITTARYVRIAPTGSSATVYEVQVFTNGSGIEDPCKDGHTTVKIPAVAPTCTTVGSTEGAKCTVCGLVTAAPEEVPVTSHTYGAYTQITAPTCTEAGSEKAACTECGDEYTRVVKATGHTLEKQADGSVKCTVCNETIFVAESDPCENGHTPVEIPAVAPTCTEAGATAGTECSVCHELIKAPEQIAAKGHTEKTNADGSITCEVCGDVIKEADPETPVVPDGTNIASGKPVKLGWNGTSVDVLTDGVVFDNYQCATIPKENFSIETSDVYYEIDLGAVYTLEALKVAGANYPQYYYYWEAYATDDITKPISEWTKITEKKNDTVQASDTETLYEVASNEGFRYIRVYGTESVEKQWHMFHVSEIEVYGTEYVAPENGDAAVYAIVFAVVAMLGTAVVVTKKVRV